MVYAHFQKAAVDAAGNVLPNIWCEVRREGVTGSPLEPLFADRDGTTPLDNPFMAENGVPDFYCAGGAFRIRYYKAGHDETFRFVGIGLGAESDIQGLTPKGAWDTDATYEIGDLVSHEDGGDTYLFASRVNDNIGNEPDTTPADTAEWMYVPAAQGAPGEPGPPGDPGEQGETGPANTLTIGTVEGGPSADAEITGTAPNQTLNLVLPQGDAGADGWSPVFAIATDGARRVLQLAGYVGGTGTEPTDHVGEYVGASGYTSIGDAVDIRGPAGAAGSGSGDMQASVYDPQGIEDDAFDRANHTGTQSADTITDGTTNKAFTGTEKTKLGYITVTQAVDLDAIEAAVVPAGGTTGQVLKKASNADNDTVWEDDAGGIGGSTGSIDNRLLRSDGSGGATVQPSAITVDDSGNMSGVGTFNGYTPREVLTANRTYYVRTDGSDSNNGLSNTSGGAFLTIAKALQVAASLDCSTFNVTIQVGDGTWTAGVVLPQMIGSGTFTLRGNTTTPANCILSVTGSTAVTGDGVMAWTVTGFKVQTTTSGVGVTARNGAVINLGVMDYGTVAGAQHILAGPGGRIIIASNYTISGNSSYAHWGVAAQGYLQAYSRTVTASGSRAFTIFVDCSFGYVDSGAMTFSGTFTGQRYSVNLNGVIFTSGGGASYFPGDSAGATATGGQYA